MKTFTTREIMFHHGVDKHRAWVMARYLVNMGMAKVVRIPPSGGTVYGTILDIKNKGLWERRKAGPKPEPSFYSNPFNLRNAVDGRWR